MTDCTHPADKITCHMCSLGWMVYKCEECGYWEFES